MELAFEIVGGFIYWAFHGFRNKDQAFDSMRSGKNTFVGAVVLLVLLFSGIAILSHVQH